MNESDLHLFSSPILGCLYFEYYCHWPQFFLSNDILGYMIPIISKLKIKAGKWSSMDNKKMSNLTSIANNVYILYVAGFRERESGSWHQISEFPTLGIIGWRR